MQRWQGRGSYCNDIEITYNAGAVDFDVEWNFDGVGVDIDSVPDLANYESLFLKVSAVFPDGNEGYCSEHKNQRADRSDIPATVDIAISFPKVLLKYMSFLANINDLLYATDKTAEKLHDAPSIYTLDDVQTVLSEKMLSTTLFDFNNYAVSHSDSIVFAEQSIRDAEEKIKNTKEDLKKAKKE